MPWRSGNLARYSLFFGFVLGGGLGACSFHREGAAVERLRAQILRELGSNASVNVHSAYGSTTVTIRLQPLPPGDSRQVQARVEALTKAEFPSTEYVVLLGRP